MNDLDFRILITISKGRNIVYYRKIDRRERAQYLHVLRDYRKQLSELLHLIPQTPEYFSTIRLFNSLISIIDPKVTSFQATQTIIEMEKVLYEK